MLTDEQFVLMCIAEECNEVAHRCSKAIRFGIGEVQKNQTKTNGERFVDELTDLLALIELMRTLDEHAHSPSRFPAVTREGIDAKKAKFLRNLEYSRSLGV